MATNTERDQQTPSINAAAVMNDQASAGAAGPASEPVTLQNHFTQTAEEAQRAVAPAITQPAATLPP
jgi:hypothetical protein